MRLTASRLPRRVSGLPMLGLPASTYCMRLIDTAATRKPAPPRLLAAWPHWNRRRRRRHWTSPGARWWPAAYLLSRCCRLARRLTPAWSAGAAERLRAGGETARCSLPPHSLGVGRRETGLEVARKVVRLRGSDDCSTDCRYARQAACDRTRQSSILTVPGGCG